MNRFFVDRKNILGEKQRILVDDIESIKHISKVLRLKEGDSVEICDGESRLYLGEIVQISKREIEFKILDSFTAEGEPTIEVTLFQGIPKGAKMEMIVQKCTELGIHRIVPLASDRSVVQLKDRKEEMKKVERWQKIAEEAAKQSKRIRIPQVEYPITLNQMTAGIENMDLLIIPYEKEKECSLKTVLREYKEAKKIGVLIGPEGGFEESEIQFAKNLGIIPITLGKRILRTETAGLTVVSILMYELGDLGGI
ncbi:MAG: 16S rRNA (uracil(1498)-N(3))-methyltransferase [Thermotaleaceae bacterium]